MAKNEVIRWSDRYPCLGDRTKKTSFDRHYTYHPAWAARVLAQTRPEYHIDISSIIVFNAVVSAFVPIKFYDYRPAELELSNLEANKVDILKLPFADNTIVSISCMHVIEHIGLGRYGDAIDPLGDIKALAELERVVAVGGDLLLVVPVGVEAVRFNGHRVYDHNKFVSYLKKSKLHSCTLIPDDGPMIDNPSLRLIYSQKDGCACYWFKKIYD